MNFGETSMSKKTTTEEKKKLSSELLKAPTGFSATEMSEGGTSPLRSIFRGKWMAWIVLSASLAVTIFTWYLARGVALERGHDRFVFRTQTIESALRERLHAYAFLLQSGTGLFAGSDKVTRAQWRRYVTALQIDQHYPGVQGLGFSKRIPASEKEAHIRQIREEGFPDYDIHPEGERPEYTSIIFLEPFDWRNQRAFGYDMFSEPTRKEAMVMARDTGSVAMSGKITLLQETEEDVQAGFLMYLPLYRTGEVPKTPEQRREALTGYVYSPFRMNDFMQGLLIEKREYVELQIFDGDEPLKDALLYPSGSMESRLSHSGHVHSATCQSILEYAGRRWLLVFTSSPYFEGTIDTGQVNSILVLGGIISLLLFFVVLWLIKSRNQALSLANMTLDLEKANLGLKREIAERKQAEENLERYSAELEKKNQELHSANEQLSVLLDSLPIAVYRCAAEGDYAVTYMSQNVISFTGYTARNFMDQSDLWFSHIHPDDTLSVSDEMESLLENGRHVYEYRWRKADGRYLWIRDSLRLVRSEDGTPNYLVGMWQDITDDTLAAEALRKANDDLSLFRRLLDNSSDAIEVIDPMTLRFLDVNETACRELGYSREELLTLNIQDIDPNIKTDTLSMLNDQLAESGSASFETTHRRKDGSIFPVEINMGTATLGERTYRLAIVRDITERKRGEEELRRYSAELEKKNKELQDALANVKQLSGMLPICSWCKQIRDDKGYWKGVESYISEHTEAVFTHGLCPVCLKKMEEDLDKLKKEKK
jgi:PAS domain S-box-containing protein